MSEEDLYKYYRRKTKDEIIEELLYKCNVNYYLISKIYKAIEKLKEHKQDLDYEPWSEYKINGKILFDLVDILKGSDTK